MDKDNLNTMINGENKTLTKKHIAERQRRARINTYLEEIQMLTSAGSGTTAPSKLEKAEVLERAVFYLQNAQGLVDPNNNSNVEMDDIEIYKQGYTSCMNKIFDHVSQSYDLLPEAPGMKRHLDNFLQNNVTQMGDNGGVKQDVIVEELMQTNDSESTFAMDLRCDSHVKKTNDAVKLELNKKLKVNPRHPGQINAYTCTVKDEHHGAFQGSLDSFQDTHFNGIAYQHSDLIVSVSLSRKIDNVNLEPAQTGGVALKQEETDDPEQVFQNMDQGMGGANNGIADAETMFSSSNDCLDEIESMKRQSAVWRPW